MRMFWPFSLVGVFPGEASFRIIKAITFPSKPGSNLPHRSLCGPLLYSPIVAFFVEIPMEKRSCSCGFHVGGPKDAFSVFLFGHGSSHFSDLVSF